MLHRSNRLVNRLLVLLIAASLAAGCYGPEEKKRRFFEKGRTLQAAGETVKATLEYKNALQIDPNFQPAYSALAEIAFSERDYEKAYKYLAKAVEINPDYLPSQVLLGKLFLLGKALDRAREKVDLVLDRDSDQPDALLLNAAILLA
jgi:tetratricopeptide (TPR) repeat protein